MKRKTNSSLTIHPQTKNFRRQNQHLQSGLARLLVERDDLVLSIIPHMEADYQLKFGFLKWRVFQLDCEVRAFMRRIEMAQAALNRGEQPSYQNIEADIKTEFAAWQEHLRQLAADIKAAEEREKLPTLSPEKSVELRNPYRALALKLHPDILQAPDERQSKLWLSAAEAYKSGDLPTLQLIALLIVDDSVKASDAEETVSLLDALKSRNAGLKEMCEKILAEISGIKTTVPYTLHEILGDEIELERRQTELREQIETLREKRQYLVENWKEILRFAVDIDEIEIPDEPPDIFDDDDNWSEFIY